MPGAYTCRRKRLHNKIPTYADICKHATRRQVIDPRASWQATWSWQQVQLTAGQRAWCDHYGSELWKVKNKQCCKEMSDRVTAHSNGHYDREIDRLRIRWINELSVVCTQAICYASIRRMYVRLLPKCCGKGKEQTSISANNSIMKV